MPASKAEQVLEEIKASLETISNAVVERNSVLPEKILAGGLIILRDGDPGEPEQALGGFGNVYYQHAVEIEVYIEEGDAGVRDAAFDEIPNRDGSRSRPEARRPCVRHDLRPARAENRGDRGRAGDQERDAHRDRRLRERRSSLLISASSSARRS
jgi:hypothetical protein